MGLYIYWARSGKDSFFKVCTQPQTCSNHLFGSKSKILYIPTLFLECESTYEILPIFQRIYVRTCFQNIQQTKTSVTSFLIQFFNWPEIDLYVSSFASLYNNVSLFINFFFVEVLSHCSKTLHYNLSFHFILSLFTVMQLFRCSIYNCTFTIHNVQSISAVDQRKHFPIEQGKQNYQVVSFIWILFWISLTSCKRVGTQARSTIKASANGIFSASVSIK